MAFYGLCLFASWCFVYGFENWDSGDVEFLKNELELKQGIIESKDAEIELRKERYINTVHAGFNLLKQCKELEKENKVLNNHVRTQAMELLKNLYDKKGYDRGNKNNTMQTESTSVNGGIAVSGQEMPTGEHCQHLLFRLEFTGDKATRVCTDCGEYLLNNSFVYPPETLIIKEHWIKEDGKL